MGSVKAMLTNIVNALLDNPDRKFTWAEMKFFSMWWKQQNIIKKNQVRYLIMVTRQLQFVNGGWVANDEACPLYQDIINNFMIGQDFIINEFGSKFLSKVGWQLDPFGHSKMNQRLFRDMGLEAMFAAR